VRANNSLVVLTAVEMQMNLSFKSKKKQNKFIKIKSKNTFRAQTFPVHDNPFILIQTKNCFVNDSDKKEVLLAI
jgi:hypothetical protein